MALRITTHKGRTTKSGTPYSARHLDRKFDLKKAKHIDPTRVYLNRYVEFDVDENGILHHAKSNNIQEHELAVYERLFKLRLDAINDRYKARRHKEKCKSVKQYYCSPQSCPDEYLIYIGNKDAHASSEVLTNAASELIRVLQKKYAENFIPLSIALHRDELGIGEDGEGAHLHFRCVWICADKDGTKASITQGMKAAGIRLPDDASEVKRGNNRQMEFSKEIRETFADICEKNFGLEIEREARSSSEAGKDLVTYQRDQAKIEVQMLEEKRLQVQSEAALEAHRKERLTAEVCALTSKKASLEATLSRLKSILLPVQKLFAKLQTYRINSTRTVLDDILLDASTAPAYEAIRELDCRV